MSFHSAIDNLSTGIGSLYGDKVRFFREGIRSISPAEMTAALEMDFTPSSGEGEYRVPVRFGAIEGAARYSVIHWTGGGKPTIIYHHGSGETKYDARIRQILPEQVRDGFNLIALSIPFNSSMKEYLHGIGSLERFVFLLSSSVRLAEHLGAWLREQGDGKTLLSGISLGGWITNLHFGIYGTMDEYRPTFAGAALDHLFNSTVYRGMISAEAREHPRVLEEALNFEELFRKKSPEKLFPLLARHDQYIRFERQKDIYLEKQVSVLEKGHITGALDTKALREHLLRGLS